MGFAISPGDRALRKEVVARWKEWVQWNPDAAKAIRGERILVNRLCEHLRLTVTKSHGDNWINGLVQLG